MSLGFGGLTRIGFVLWYVVGLGALLGGDPVGRVQVLAKREVKDSSTQFAQGGIAAALSEAGVRFDLKLYAAEHAFMRDEGPRYDPEATDGAFTDMLGLFRRTLN